MKKTILSSLLVFSLMFSQVQAKESFAAKSFSMGVKTGLMLLGVAPGALLGLYLGGDGVGELKMKLVGGGYHNAIDFLERNDLPILVGLGVAFAIVGGLYGWNNMSEFELAKGAYRYRDPSAHPDTFFHKLVVWENGDGVDYSLDDLRQIRDNVGNGKSIPRELLALSDVYGEGKFLSILREEIEVVENLIKNRDRVTYWRGKLPLLGFFTRRIQAFIANALKSGEAFRRLDEYHAYLCYMEEIFVTR